MPVLEPRLGQGLRQPLSVELRVPPRLREPPHVDQQLDAGRPRRIQQRLEKARTSAEMDRQKIANISVIQPAYAPLQPVSPRPMLNLLAALVIGGGLAVGAALLTERLTPNA